MQCSLGCSRTPPHPSQQTSPATLPARPQDPDPDIRQSGFALVGDLAKACAPHLKPALVRGGRSWGAARGPACPGAARWRGRAGRTAPCRAGRSSHRPGLHLRLPRAGRPVCQRSVQLGAAADHAAQPERLQQRGLVPGCARARAAGRGGGGGGPPLPAVWSTRVLTPLQGELARPSCVAALTSSHTPISAGELAIKCGGEELKPVALPALERLAQILQARRRGLGPGAARWALGASAAPGAPCDPAAWHPPGATCAPAPTLCRCPPAACRAAW